MLLDCLFVLKFVPCFRLNVWTSFPYVQMSKMKSGLVMQDSSLSLTLCQCVLVYRYLFDGVNVVLSDKIKKGEVVMTKFGS